MRWRRRRRAREPCEFDALAHYNAECARGIVHTPAYDAQMRLEQQRFAARRHENMLAEGWEELGDGVWIRQPAPYGSVPAT